MVRAFLVNFADAQLKYKKDETKDKVLSYKLL